MDWVRVAEILLVVLSVLTAIGVMVRWLLTGARDRIIWEVEQRTAPLRANGGEGLADVPQRLDHLQRSLDEHVEEDAESLARIDERLRVADERATRIEERQVAIVATLAQTPFDRIKRVIGGSNDG
jgi:hypothetical protein